MQQKMPHLQDDMAEERSRNQNGNGSMSGTDSSSSLMEELPIQVASPNFLATSDPVVAMANKVSAAVVDSSFESVEHNPLQSLSSPPPHRVIKTVITPSPSSGHSDTTSSNSSTTDEVSTTESESTSFRENNAIPILTTVYGNSRLPHSPIEVKRRVSQSEDEKPSTTSQQQHRQHIIRESTFLKYGESPSTAERGRPAIIRRGSSLVSGKRTTNANPNQEEPSQSKKMKSEDNDVVAVSDDTTSGSSTVSKTAAIEAAAAASAMADMRNKKPAISAIPSKEKGEDDVSDGNRQLPPFSHHPHHFLHQNFHPGVVAPPPFHPHLASFGGHPFGPNAGYPMVYPGYPPHVPPGTIPPFMVGQFHGHPMTGFYAPYPGFQPHPINQHGGQHVLPFGSPLRHTSGAALSPPKTFSSTGSTNTEDKDHGKRSNAMPSMYVRSNSPLDQSINSSSSSSKSGAVGKPLNINRCIPLQEPIPSKHWG